MTDERPPICFDMFNSFVKVDATPREELRNYIRQCVDPTWNPLELPESWRQLEAFEDTREGFERLREKYRVIVLSNAPVELSFSILRNNSLSFDGAIPLEKIRRYKPHPECYTFACEQLGVKPGDAMMVTANPTFGPYPFGDLHIAGAIGMQTQLIRNPGCPQTIIELAEQLGC